MPDKKSFIVSLHDAHPGSRAQIAEQVAFLAERGVTRSSILVVPEFHHQGSVTKDAAFCDDVSKWQAGGHEIVLHGYYHDRKESAPDTFSNYYWTRIYTAGEAEFLDITKGNAKTRLELGRLLFESLGWRANGFVAPAWLMAPWIPSVLAEMEFAYTTTLKEIVPLAAGTNQVTASQSLCYSARASWRRFASAVWNKHLFQRQRETNLVRLSLHPRDLEFPLLRRQIDQIVRSAVKRGFEPTTYGEYVAR